MKKSFLSLLFIVLFPSSAAVAEDLLQVYRLAQDNDAQLRQAGAVRDAVYESRPQALARLFPTLSASSEKRWLHVNHHNSSRDLNSSNPERFNLSLDLSQPIYRRDYWIQLEQADLQIAQAEAEYAAQEQELIIRTAEAYFDILSAKDELEFARAENESIGRQLEQSKQRFEVGLIAITDVYESKAAFDQSRADLIVAENNVFQAWQVLYEIILENVEEIVPLAEELPLDPPDPQDIEAWSETALQQNLSIQAAEYGKNIAQQEIDVQRSGHFPTLDLVGSHSVDRGSKSEALEADTKPAVRAAAAQALGTVGGPAALPALAKAASIWSTISLSAEDPNRSPRTITGRLPVLATVSIASCGIEWQSTRMELPKARRASFKSSCRARW